MISASHVFAVFKQQVPCTFIDSLVLFGGLTIFADSDLIDNQIKIGHDVEQIEDDFSLRQFFLTALIYGSHISMTIASMALRCLTVNLLKNLSRVLALRSLPTKTTRPLR